jgi:hypothetical protein
VPVVVGATLRLERIARAGDRIDGGMALAAAPPMARRSSRFGARLGLASALLIALVCAALSWQLARGARADVQRYLALRADRVVETFAREAGEAMQRSDMDALAEAAAACRRKATSCLPARSTRAGWCWRRPDRAR